MPSKQDCENEWTFTPNIDEIQRLIDEIIFEENTYCYTSNMGLFNGLAGNLFGYLLIEENVEKLEAWDRGINSPQLYSKISLLARCITLQCTGADLSQLENKDTGEDAFTKLTSALSTENVTEANLSQVVEMTVRANVSTI
jgi:hypothetical protein